MKKALLMMTLLLSVTISFAQQIKYTSGNDSWNADSLGNHRAIVQFSGIGKVAHVIIPWRRWDEAAAKRIIVQDAASQQKIVNVKTGVVNNESGEIYFEPVSGKGNYYIYYLPYKNEGRSNYPKGVYLKPENTADAAWLQSIPPVLKTNTVTTAIQSINDFSSFFPMEIIATEKETATLIAKSRNKDFMVFPEDRLFSVRMKDRLPSRWVQKATASFAGEASRGEYYAYQLAVFALQDIDQLHIVFSDLKNTAGNKILSKNISCINLSGIDYTGTAFTKNVSVAKGQVQPMWCGIDIDKTTAPGIYKGSAILAAKGTQPVIVSVSIKVNDQLAENSGEDEPWKMTRLKWLNSTLAQDNTVIAPYTALQVSGKTISLLGRKVELNDDGFPKQIQSFFTQEMTGYKDSSNKFLYEPMHFHFTKKADGKDFKLKNTGLEFTNKTAGTVQWKSFSSNDTMQLELEGSLEFDGFVSYKIKVTALQDVTFKDVTMHIPVDTLGAKYMMGLGQKGGLRPEKVEWKWDVSNKNQDGAWIGNVNLGLQYALRDEHYVRPLNTNFYLQKPLLMPGSWGNEGKGGIVVGIKGKSMLVNNYTGEREMKKGDVLYYNFNLLITPFHPINTDFQWATRFYHKYDNLDTVKASNATVVNIHHATAINPWINYPFIEHKKMKAYIDEAHQKVLKVKIYNTVRELSNHAYETFAMRSLGHEIYSTGKGGGYSWLQEHLGNDYIAAWFVPEIKDAAIINSGMSRWHNYYVEGMNWLTKKVGIDGIYLDDVAFDRTTMKRIKRVLTADGHPGIIDLHSANQYNKNDGFNNSANLYMEHFPYLNKLWFGEYFDYQKNGPDFFLTEVSGIPFGLMGEMLQDGGNPWRGMIYGMTNRYPWDEHADPRPIWKLWDAFGMKGTEMIGYWVDSTPVKTNNDKVLATIYKKKDAVMIAIASWADEKVDVQLLIDWKKLGIDPAGATITAPAVKNFQEAATFKTGENIPMEKGKGWILILK